MSAKSCLSHHAGCACHEERHALQIVRLQARIDELTLGHPTSGAHYSEPPTPQGPGADLPPEVKAAEWEAAARTLREENRKLREEKQVLQASLDEIQSLVSSISLLCFSPELEEIASDGEKLSPAARTCADSLSARPWDTSERGECGHCRSRLGWVVAWDGARRCVSCDARSCPMCGVMMSVHWSCVGRFS